MENLFEHVEFGLVVDQCDQNYCMDPIRISNTMTVKWHLKVKVEIRINVLYTIHIQTWSNDNISST